MIGFEEFTGKLLDFMQLCVLFLVAMIPSIIAFSRKIQYRLGFYLINGLFWISIIGWILCLLFVLFPEKKWETTSKFSLFRGDEAQNLKRVTLFQAINIILLFLAPVAGELWHPTFKYISFYFLMPLQMPFFIMFTFEQVSLIKSVLKLEGKVNWFVQLIPWLLLMLGAYIETLVHYYQIR